MREQELVAIIKTQRANSLGVDAGDLSAQRATALDHYHGRPYGNEQDGRSQVVSKDLSEAVDWAMPAIMRVFTASDNIAEFIPVGPEDEALAEQESDYTNKVIMQDNDGWLLLHDACKDALILKNGYVKYWWDTSEKIEEEEYSGITLEELVKISSDLEANGSDIKIVAQEEKVIDMGGVPVSLFDIKIKVTTKTGKCIIQAVPSEEVRVSKRCRGSLQDSPFTEHVTVKTRSDLIEMGMPKDFVSKLASLAGERNDEQVHARDSVDDESGDYGASSGDKSQDEIEFCEAYIKVDWDGDGIAELRKVVTVSDKIPPGEEWNEVIPAVPLTSFMPKRIPHRHVGESLDDDLADLQEIKTILSRQMLDNIYLTNNNQWIVNERVNLKDFLQSFPGGVKRVSGQEPVSGSVEPVMAVPIVGQILPVIDYIDNLKESRTGISKATSGLDPDSLRDSTKGAFLENLNRASQKIEMIARMLAETGVKELVRQVHGVLLRYQDKERIIKLRGQYVSVNPREWKERNDLVVKVGIGTGNEQEKREKLMLMVQAQEKLAGLGLVGPQHGYALFTDIAKNLGFELPEKYAFDPSSPEFQQFQQSQGQPSNPLAEAEQVKGQYVIQKAQIDQEAKIKSDVLNAEAKNREAAIDAELRRDEMTIQANLEMEKTIATLSLEREIGLAKMNLEAYLASVQQPGVEVPEGPGISDIINQLGAQTQAIIDTLSRPKTVVYGPNGRDSGVA